MERLPLTPLSALWVPRRPIRVQVIPLACTIGLFVASMRLPWHHHTIPAAGYTVVYGIQGASWLLVAAAIAAIFAVRLLVDPPGGYTKFLLMLLTFLVVAGMFADYVDSQTRAAQLYVSAYFGLGFYVGLAGLGTLVLATVLVCALRD